MVGKDAVKPSIERADKALVAATKQRQQQLQQSSAPRPPNSDPGQSQSAQAGSGNIVNGALSLGRSELPSSWFGAAVTGFELLQLNESYLVLFRRVWTRAQQLVQGMVVERGQFF